MTENIPAFILSHKRAGNVKTYDKLLEAGFEGSIYIVIDNEDPEADQYIKTYGKSVIVFDKKKAAASQDIME